MPIVPLHHHHHHHHHGGGGGSQGNNHNNSPSPHRHARTPTSTFIQTQVFHRRGLYLDSCERDRVDARKGLERERKFTVAWQRLSRNQIWKNQPGPPVVLFEDSIQQYKHHQKIWPLGRPLEDLTLYSQILDYVRYMWQHTKPYKTVALIVLMATTRPLHNAALSFVTGAITNDPEGTSLWVYFFPLWVHVLDRFLFWWYQFHVPKNSQRYQLRCMLLTRRVEFPDSHPIAIKWTAGRFNGLLRDVDELVNGVWGSFLKIIEELVTILWTTILCLIQLAVNFQRGRDENLPDPLPTKEYVVYAILFLALGLITMICPFLWFNAFEKKYNECETMSRDGQALYLSAASHAVMVDPPSENDSYDDIEAPSIFRHSQMPTTSVVEQKRGLLTEAGKHSFRVFALSTFRSFFLKLAWSTNYTTLVTGIGCVATVIMLRSESFGNSFSIASTMIVLLSLGDFTRISFRLLNLITVMSKGCLVLTDVAEILNCEDYNHENDNSDTKKNINGNIGRSISTSSSTASGGSGTPPSPRGVDEQQQQQQQVMMDKSSFLSTISERDTSDEDTASSTPSKASSFLSSISTRNTSSDDDTCSSLPSKASSFASSSSNSTRNTSDDDTSLPSKSSFLLATINERATTPDGEQNTSSPPHELDPNNNKDKEDLLCTTTKQEAVPQPPRVEPDGGLDDDATTATQPWRPPHMQTPAKHSSVTEELPQQHDQQHSFVVLNDFNSDSLVFLAPAPKRD